MDEFFKLLIFSGMMNNITERKGFMSFETEYNEDEEDEEDEEDDFYYDEGMMD